MEERWAPRDMLNVGLLCPQDFFLFIAFMQSVHKDIRKVF